MRWNHGVCSITKRKANDLQATVEVGRVVTEARRGVLNVILWQKYWRACEEETLTCFDTLWPEWVSELASKWVQVSVNTERQS